MKVIAIRQLRGDYGSVRPGEQFEVYGDTAKHLLRAGLVREPDPFTREVKAIQPAHTEPSIEAVEPRHQNKRK